ncbi:MAG: ABC transporter ATP-binding protein, partial [Clostridia bacterium]|nr:ABC transporter ATP-binding protein [Clostridia bacterium]
MKQNDQNRAVLRKVLREVGRQRGPILLSLLLALIQAGLQLTIPLLTGQAVDLIVGPAQVDFAGLTRVLTLLALAAAGAALAQYGLGVLNNRVTCETVRDLRARAFEKLQRLPLAYLDARPHGETISRVMSDVDTFADGLLLGFSQLFTGVVTIVGTLIFMFSVDPAVALIVVVLTPVSLLTASFIARRTHDMFAAQSAARAVQTGQIDEMVEGSQVAAVFGATDVWQERFDRQNEALRSASLQAIFFSSLTNPVTRFVNALVYAGAGVFGALRAVRGLMTVGQLTSFLSYANQYTKPFNEISGVVTELQNALVCAGRVFELIETPAEAADVSAELPTPEGLIRAQDVSFSYVPEKPLIEHLNVVARPGQRVAIVGPTGCGKTTLINLLMRFYDVNGGGISVDGTDIRRVTRHSLRRAYGMVLQDTWLRAGTIRENICFGRPEATEEEMVAAAKAARADSFIRRLPNGYDTVIGEDGGSLSQGQKQLLCIARVMLDLPPMLILDEATSSIDTRTELKVQAAFAQMMKGRTSFIVAHRLSTIRSADLILVMRDGHVIEQGAHDE